MKESDVWQHMVVDITNEKGRKTYIDSLKGFLVLLVIWSHSSIFNMEVGRILTVCYMPAFFIISGFLKKEAHNSLVKAIEKNAKRTLIPYIVYGIGGGILALAKYEMGFWDAVVAIIYGRFMLYPGDFSESNIFFLRDINSPLWFFVAFFLSSIIGEFLIIKRNLINVGICIALTIWLAYWSILLPWSIDTCFLGGCFIFMGYIIKKCEERINGWVFIFSVVIYVGCIYLNPNVNMSIRDYGNHGVWSIFLFGIAGVCGTWCYLCIFKQIDAIIRIRFLEFVGRKSVTFIGLHIFFLQIGGIKGLLLAIVCCSLVAWLFEGLGKKYKIFKYL